MRPQMRLGKVIAAVLFLVLFFSTFFLYVSKVSATAGINPAINFQGKVVNADGTNVTDGAYSFVFKLYNDNATGASAIYTEDWSTAGLWQGTVSSRTDADTIVYATDTNESTIAVGQYVTNITKGETVIVRAIDTGTNTLDVSDMRQTWAASDVVTNKTYVKNGVFRVSIGTLTSISAIDFNNTKIFLGVNFNGDGEMRPMIQYTAAPYAFNAKTVSGLTVTDTTGTFTLAAAKVFTVNNTLTLAGTDSTSFTFPSTTGGTVITNNAPTQTITSTQTTGTILGIADSTGLSGTIVGQSITLSGTGVQDQTGLQFALSGATGTNLNDIVGSGSTWKVSKAGDLTVNSCSGCNGGGADLDTVYSTDSDKTMTINNAAGLIFNNTSTGNIVMQDNSVAAFTFAGFSDTVANGLTFTSAAAASGVSIAATGSDTDIALTLNSKANGTLSLDSGTTGAINIGNNANAKTITIGNNTTTTALNLTSGTGSQTHTSSVVSGTGTTSAFVFNASALTSGTGLYLTSTATSGKLLDMNATQTSGTIVNLAYGASKTQSGNITGLNLDLGTNLTSDLAAGGSTILAQSLNLPATTNTNTSGTNSYTGATIGGGAVILNGLGGTLNWTGLSITIPNTTQTNGTLNANGVVVNTGATTGGTLRLLDLQQNSTSRFRVDDAGSLTIINTGNVSGITLTSTTTGSTQRGFKIANSTTAFAGGKLVDIQKTGATGNTVFSGNILNVNYTQTFSSTGTLDHIGIPFNFSRAYTLTGAAAQTISGDALSFADSQTTNSSGSFNWTSNTGTIARTCTATLGTCTSSGNVLSLTRSGSAEGTLNVSGALLSLTDNALTGAGSLTHTGNVLTLTQSNTITAADVLTISNSGTGKDISGTSNTWNVTKTGAATFATVNGNTITTGTGILTLGASKTLTVSDSTTLDTNAITLAGGEVITFSATNALSLLTTGTTSVTLPTGGTLLTNTASAVQTLTSTQTTGTIFTITDSAALSGALIGQQITLAGTNVQAQTGLSFNVSGAGTLKDINGTGGTWSVTPTGAATFATVNGNTITTGTGILTLGASKTLTVSDSTTLDTNAITLAGGEVITFSATNALSLLTTGTTSVTLPTGGTLLTNTASAVQTLTSTQTTGTILGIADSTGLSGAIVGQSITLSGTGVQDQTGLQFALSGATGTNLNDIVGSGSTWKISKAGALTITSCSGCPGGAPTWDQILAPTASTAFNLNMYQAVGEASGTTTFTWGTNTGASNLFTVQDTTANTGTGYLFTVGTVGTSTVKPLKLAAKNTTIFDTSNNGDLTLGAAATLTGVLTLQTQATSGTGITLNANAITGANTGIAINANGLTSSGTGLAIATTGALSSTAKLASFTANGATGASIVTISGTGLTTGKGLVITGGTAMTTGSDLEVNGATYVQTGANTGSLAQFTFINSSTNTSGNSIVNGLNVTSTVSTSGATGTKDTNAISVSAPTLTGCTGGLCNWDGIHLETTAPTSQITVNGLNIAGATAPSSSTINGINIGNITGGAGAENAITIGSGWDNGIFYNATTGNLIVNTANNGGGAAAGLQFDVGTSSSGAPAINIGTTANSVGKTITLGATGQTGIITLGQSTATNTINIGNGNIASGNTQTINIGATATSTGKDVITIGNNIAASSLSLDSGTGNIAIGTGTTNARTITIGAAATVNDTINIGTSTANGATTINIGTGHNSARVVLRDRGNSVPGADLATAGQIMLGNAGSTANLGRIWIKSGTVNFRFSSAANSPDYSEYLQQEDTSEPGDVMVLSNKNFESVKKSEKAYDQNVLGVITRYGTGNNDDDCIDANGNDCSHRNNPHYANVGMLGQVYTKTSNENGEIKPGDQLATSSVKGVAMKANKAGRIVGFALDYFDGTQSGQDLMGNETAPTWEETIDIPGKPPKTVKIGKILILLQAGWYDPDAPPPDISDVTLVPPNSSGETQDYGLQVISTGDNVNSQLVKKDAVIANLTAGLTFAQKTFTEQLNVGSGAFTVDASGDAFLKGTLTVNKIKANQIEGLEIYTDKVDKLSKTLDTIAANLSPIPDASASGQLSSGITFSSGTFEDLITQGGLTVEKNATFKGETVFEKLVTLLANVIFRGEVSFDKVPLFNKDTAGFARIKSGEQYVNITFDEEYKYDPVVNITVNSPKLTQETYEKAITSGECVLPTTVEECEQKLIGDLFASSFRYVVAQKTTKGFTIQIDKPTTTDLNFSWSALAVKDPKTFERNANAQEQNWLTPVITETPTPTSIYPTPTILISPPEASPSAN